MNAPNPGPPAATPGHRTSEHNKSSANACTRPLSPRPGTRLDHPRRVAPGARSHAGSRCGRNRQRCRWRYQRTDAQHCRLQGAADRRRPAEDQQRFPPAGKRSLCQPVPGRSGPHEQGRRDHHPSGPCRRRHHAGQLDLELSHAATDPGALGRGPQRDRPGRGAIAPLVRTHRTGTGHHPLGPAAECQQRRAAPWLRTTGLPLGGDPAQRARLLEPGLLRHGLPGECQAIDAGHAYSRHPRTGRRAAVLGSGGAFRAQRRAHPGPVMPGPG